VLGRWEDLATLLERHATLVDDPTKKAELLLSAGAASSSTPSGASTARACFERALEIEPATAAALELNARVAALQGDVRAATEAYDKLARRRRRPAEKVEVLLKAASCWRRRATATAPSTGTSRPSTPTPTRASATARLRELYASRGDAQGAIELLQREIEAAEGNNQRAALWAQVARIYRDRVKDNDEGPRRGGEGPLLDATNEEAAVMLGELHFDAGAWDEAAKLLAARAAGRRSSRGPRGSTWR
jgi:tetratricopeptide (TPR) repeat protein